MIKPIEIIVDKPVTYQKEIIKWLEQDDVTYVSFLKSRQSGGSWLNKWLVGKWGLENRNLKIAYITPTYKLGKRFYLELKKSLRDFIANYNNTDLVLQFNTGSYVQFFSAESANSIRGFQHHYTILDEAAYMDTNTFYEILQPTWTIIGKKVIMCSTPNGNDGFFYDYITNGLNGIDGFKSKCISIYDNPFIKKETIEQIRRSIPDRVFRQEYMGEFLDGSGTVFTNYKNCIGDFDKFNKKYYAAIDWGKQNDYTVLTVMNSRKQVVEIYRINNMDYTQQVRLIADKLNFYKPIKTISEENNMGVVINEMLKKLYKGSLKCITLDNSLKKTIIEKLVVGFEQNDIVIPNNQILLSELKSFTVKYNTQTQTIKYAAGGSQHDDTVISLAYCYWNLKSGKGHYSIM